MRLILALFSMLTPETAIFKALEVVSRLLQGTGTLSNQLVLLQIASQTQTTAYYVPAKLVRVPTAKSS